MQRFILRTNIETWSQVERLTNTLKQQSQITSISVDMDDIDRVLVVDAEFSRQEELISLVQGEGIYCAELPE